MDYNQILKEVNEIFKEVLDNDSLVLTPASSAKEIDEWDSLSHIQLVVAIEKHFKLRFTTAQIQNWKNVGGMCEDIEKSLKG